MVRLHPPDNFDSGFWIALFYDKIVARGSLEKESFVYFIP